MQWLKRQVRRVMDYCVSVAFGVARALVPVAQPAAFDLNRLLGIIGSVVILVVGLVLYPIVTSQVTETLNDPNTNYFTGTGPLLKLAPLLYTVGLLGLAGAVAVFTFRSAERGS